MAKRVPRTVGHRRLEHWLKLLGLTVTEYAQRIGVRPMVIRHMIKGRRRASLHTAVAIEAETDGYILPRHWTEQE